MTATQMADRLRAQDNGREVTFYGRPVVGVSVLTDGTLKIDVDTRGAVYNAAPPGDEPEDDTRPPRGSE